MYKRQEHNCPVSQVALNWSTQKDFVGTALVGVRSEAHADENCAAFAWELSEAEILRLDNELERLGL